MRYFLWLLVFSSKLLAFPGIGDGSLLKRPQPVVSKTSTEIILIQTDAAQSIWGNYYFAVQNSSSSEEEFTVHLRLPKETVDFKEGEGLASSDISLNKEGLLTITKKFKSGLSLQSVQFRAPVMKDSENILTFKPAEDVPVLYFATTQKEILKFSAKDFEKGLPSMLEGGQYEGIKGQNIKKDEQILLSITGIPGGRRPFFLLALGFAVVLFLSASLLTRLKKQEEDEPQKEALHRG